MAGPGASGSYTVSGEVGTPPKSNLEWLGIELGGGWRKPIDNRNAHLSSEECLIEGFTSGTSVM